MLLVFSPGCFTFWKKCKVVECAAPLARATALHQSLRKFACIAVLKMCPRFLPHSERRYPGRQRVDGAKPLLLRHARRLQLQTTFETAIPGPLGFQVAGSANRFVAGHSCSILAYGRFHKGIAKGSAWSVGRAWPREWDNSCQANMSSFTSLARGEPIDISIVNQVLSSRDWLNG